MHAGQLSIPALALINSYAMISPSAFRLAVALSTASFLIAQPASHRLLKVDDMHRFHDVRDVQLSPDGKWVAYTVNSIDAVADKSDTDVWIASWDGKQHLRMTTSTESESAPRWSEFAAAHEGARVNPCAGAARFAQRQIAAAESLKQAVARDVASFAAAKHSVGVA